MIGSNIAIAIREIRKNLFRSLLTILGVIIGVAAVIAIVTIGDGAAARITSNFDRVGATTIIVTPGAERRGPPRPGSGSLGRPFEEADVDAVRQIDGIREVAATQPVPAYAITDEVQQPTLVTATTPEYLSIGGLTLAAGDGFAAPIDDGPIPAILGERAARELFGLIPENQIDARREDERDGGGPPRGPFRRTERDIEPLDPTLVIGREIDFDGTPFIVTGLLNRVERGAFGLNHNSSILVPLEAIAAGSGATPEIQMLLVAVDDVENMDAARSKIRAVLRKRRGLNENQRSDFSMRGVDQIVSMVKETTSTITTVIGLIAAISLLVGGIGIMNVMLVTVTERTREIGVRIAIGAEPNDVMMQFLVEASMLTTLGGILGLALGLGGGAIAAQIIDLPFVPNVIVIAGVMLLSIFLGAFFGFLPARRASKINPIDALRHE